MESGGSVLRQSRQKGANVKKQKKNDKLEH